MNLRLQIYLARSGIATSRRKAEELIKAGKIKINGVVAKLGSKVDSEKDKVEVESKVLKAISKKIYLMLNKPAGYLVAKSDSRDRKLAYDLLKEKSVSGNKLSEEEFNSIFNVGRLDLNSEGLLLFTNNGEFALKLTHPRYHVKKVYIAKVKGKITDEACERLARGVEITVNEPDKTINYTSARAIVRILGRGTDFSVIVIKISEGRKREVRRMCETVGFPVIELKRIQIGKIELGNLPLGRWRYLSETEIKSTSS